MTEFWNFETVRPSPVIHAMEMAGNDERLSHGRSKNARLKNTQ